MRQSVCPDNKSKKGNSSGPKAGGCTFSFLFPNPTAQTGERQTWGDVCSLLSYICIFSQRGKEAVLERQVDGMGGGVMRGPEKDKKGWQK